MSEEIRIAIFILIGLFNTGLDFGVWKLLVFLFSSSVGRPVWGFLQKKKIANIESFCHFLSAGIVVFSSYYLNKTFTFGSTKAASRTEFVTFLAVSMLGLLATTVYVYITNLPVLKKQIIKITAAVFGVNDNLHKQLDLDNLQTIQNPQYKQKILLHKPNIIQSFYLQSLLPNYSSLSKLSSIVISFTINYFGYKFLVF